MSSGHQRITWRRNIAENFNRLSRLHDRYRQTDGRRHIANVNMSSRSLKNNHRFKNMSSNVTFICLLILEWLLWHYCVRYCQELTCLKQFLIFVTSFMNCVTRTTTYVVMDWAVDTTGLIITCGNCCGQEAQSVNDTPGGRSGTRSCWWMVDQVCADPV